MILVEFAKFLWTGISGGMPIWVLLFLCVGFWLAKLIFS